MFAIFKLYKATLVPSVLMRTVPHSSSEPAADATVLCMIVTALDRWRALSAGGWVEVCCARTISCIAKWCQSLSIYLDIGPVDKNLFFVCPLNCNENNMDER